MTARAKATAREVKTKEDASSVLELNYDLGKLPSSQHRAGLAGLVLMVEWLDRNSDCARGTCEVVELTRRSLRLRLDREGLEALFDQVYAASLDEIAVKSPYKNKEPLRVIEEEVVVGKTGKTKVKNFYIYPQIIPAGAFRQGWERTADGEGKGPWTKLWRDMVWSILRGVPATRKPFQARAEEKATSDAANLWRDLVKGERALALPSTYYLGVQDKTAENVAVRDRARDLFLLHFWPYVAQIYVPVDIDSDGKRRFRGYAVAIPDVADLDFFCEELAPAMSRRDVEVSGYRPRGSLVDVSLEGGLDFFVRLKPGLKRRERAQRYADLVAGVDVFHVEKEGNNVRLRGSGRVDPDEEQIDQYVCLRGQFRSHEFRRQRMLNLLQRRPWSDGFARLLSTTSWERTIGSPFFTRDARKAFELAIEQARLKRQQEAAMTTQQESEVAEAPSLEALTYRLVRRYVFGRTESKHDVKYDDVKGTPSAKRKFNEQRAKIARDAFLGVRSRTGDDFVAYFTSTLCSVPNYLSEEAYTKLARALLAPDAASVERVRALTLLALCAHGWSPQQPKEEKSS